MRKLSLAVVVVLGGLSWTQHANAVVCAAGVYRAGCVGPHGAAVWHRPYYRHYGYRPYGAVYRRY